MTLFEQYGIKEVADVTLYSIHKKEDNSGDVYYMPALYLDTLKISTTEKTAENTWAQGGYGNARLINWDYNKNVNVSLEDALCTPASLGLCWNGILNADWHNGQVNIKSGTDNSIEKISRMEKARCPYGDIKKTTISNLLPQTKDNKSDDFELLKISSIVDGTDIQGFGITQGHTYKWKMAIESAVKSIAVIPDRFFDITGKSYPIDQERKVSVHSLPDYENYKDAIIYRINNRGRFVAPPLAKIIFDEAVANKGEEKIVNFSYTEEVENDIPSIDNLARLIVKGKGKESDWLEGKDFKVYENGLIASQGVPAGGATSTDEDYYYPLRGTLVDVAPAQYGYEGRLNNNLYYSLIGNSIVATAAKQNEISADGIYYILPSQPSDSPMFKKVVDGKIEDYTDSTPEIILITKTLYNNEILEEGNIKPEYLNKIFIFTDVDPITGRKKIYYYYSLNEPCYKITDLAMIENLKRQTLKELEDDLGISLTRYMWNHRVDMMHNEAGKEYIEQANVQYPIEKCDYLAIIVDNNDNYIPLVGIVVDLSTTSIGLPVSENYQSNEITQNRKVLWFNPCPQVDVSQFKGIDMWLKFQSINEMIYFMLTKYENDIVSIKPVKINSGEEWSVNKKTTVLEDDYEQNNEGKLWAYINPRTMKPYSDDYWFHQGESYYIKSLTLVPQNKKISGKRIIVTADQWPGMYMMVGETWIREKETGNDMRLQIRIPLAKVRSEHTLTLQAEGEPTTFNLNLEVAQPQSGELIEITAYEVRTRIYQGEDGKFYAIDGSSEVVTE